MLGDLDLTKKPQKLELFLAKPDKTIIAKLNEAYGKTQSIKLGNINELNFTIPYNVEFGHNLVDNKHIEMLRDRYLIKTLVGNKEEWYIISNIEEGANDSSEWKTVIAYSLPYEMNDKTIRDVRIDGVNIDKVMNGGMVVDDQGISFSFPGLLSTTSWTLDYVDATLATLFRSYDFSSNTILDAIFKVAETTKSILVWDTINRKISFHNPDNHGNDKGLLLSYGRYLKSLNLQSKSDEMTTVFKAWGKDGISINEVNITGQNYIEDYSFFLYPFRRDVNKNVIQSSYYMSDALANAILDYTEFIATKENVFSGYLNTLTSLQVNKTTKQNELATIAENLEVAKNNLDLAASTGADTSSLVTIRDGYQSQYNAKVSEINSIQSQINDVNSQISSLRTSLQHSVFFTPSLLNELKYYQIEKEYNDTNIDNPTDLLADAKKQFENLKMPQITLTIDIVNFLSVVEAQRDWNKLVLGDIVTIRYDHIGVNVKAKIIEYTIDYENDTITLVIANVKDILTDEEKFIKMLYNSNRASTTLDMSKSKWDGIETTRSQVAEIINNTWDANKLAIVAGINNSVSISSRGIMITNPDDPQNYLVAQNGILAITNDGGNTWKNALTKNGIVAERVYGTLIAGVNLKIDASDTGGTKIFTVDGNGVTIAGTKLTITGGLPSSQLDPSFKNGLVNLGTAYNGVVIDSSSGLVITKSDDTIRTILNATDGFKFQKNISGTWTDRLSYDATSGNLVVDGSINARELKINGVNVLAGAGSSIIKGQYIDKITAGQIDVTSAKISVAQIENLVVGSNVTMGANATISWASQVTGKPFIPSSASDVGAISSTYIDGSGVWTGFLNADKIIAGSISASYINTSGLSAEKIYQAGSPNNYGVLGGTYGDFRLFYNNSLFFDIYNSFTNAAIRYKSSEKIRFGDSGTTYFFGVLDFSGATHNIVARFG